MEINYDEKKMLSKDKQDQIGQDERKMIETEADENKLITERKRKLEEIKKLGINPYPYRYEVNARSKAVTAEFQGLGEGDKSDQERSLAGRIMSWRAMGKAIFCHIQDQDGQIQVYLRQDTIGDEKFNLTKLLDIGDFIGVKGKVFKTKKGEVSIFADSLELLTKAVRPLPEKFHGLKDPEIRYRKRYLDLIMNPEVKQTFIKRAKIYKAIRQFLDDRDYLEVQTPILQTQYGGANARPFVTSINAWNMPMYLRIAYELHLKRLTVGGLERVYDLSSCFRNEGVDKTHNPEFAMMEIQTAWEDYNYTMELAEQLWEFVAIQVNGSTVVDYNGTKIDFKAPWKRQTMKDSLKEHAGLEIDNMSDEELTEHAKKYKIEPQPRGLLIAALFEALVEEKLIQPIHITDHPVETCPLAKLHRDDKALIERVESFANGWELGNYYSELVDPEIQRSHFQEQVKRGRGGDDEAHPMDDDYIEALEYGLPPNAGIGIGIERMIMLMTSSDSIRKAILFPTMKPKS